MDKAFSSHLLIEPNASGSRFPPIYPKNTDLNFAAVNMGSEDLYVGGAGINKAFETNLSAAGHNCLKYRDLHMRAFNEWRSRPKLDDSKEFVYKCSKALEYSGLPLTTCYIKPCTEWSTDVSPFVTETTGVTIIDVFDPTSRPCKSTKNVAMIYVVGPQGSRFPDSATFLDAVRITARNMIRSIQQYNCLNGTCPINELSLALISGGLYRHKNATKVQVASAIIIGLYDAYKTDTNFCTVRLAYDNNAFGAALEHLKSSHREILALEKSISG